MSALVRGVQCFRHIPPSSEAGVTVADLADALDVTPRSIQRMLATFERAGLARREPHVSRHRPARWWRA